MMSHLTLETLARLLDEPTDRREAEHLDACALCRNELSELREQREALAALPKMMPPPDAWSGLRDRLRDEGLMLGARRPQRVAARAAAAVVLFLAGGAAGYGLRGTPALAEPDAAPSALAQREEARGAEEAVAEQASTDLRDVEEAEGDFFAALDRYMAATAPDASDPAARLAALDNIVLTTAEALAEAPADPVINSYYLTAVAQRNAVLRQIAASRRDPVF